MQAILVKWHIVTPKKILNKVLEKGKSITAY